VSRTRPAPVLAAAFLLALSVPAARTDDSPEEIAHELAEKIQKALKHAAEAQEKQRQRAAKAEKERQEELTEAQEDAAEEARKAQRRAARRAALAAKDPAKFEEEALEDLDETVEHYVKLHKRAAKIVSVPAPGPRSAPEQVLAYQRALAEAIRSIRPRARQGDVFFADVQPILKRIIAAELAGRAGAPARKALKEGNPPVESDRDDRMAVKLAVNAAYPEAAPVSTVPPSVLLNLPPMPEDYVEYRFVNRDLVLHDVPANLVVDFVRLAAPPLTTPATPSGR
jgi:hypothetical protein